MVHMVGGKEPWSIWAEDRQMRWSPTGVHGTPEFIQLIKAKLAEYQAEGRLVAITPTGPFLEARLDDPLVVAIVAWRVLLDLGVDPGLIGASPNLPQPPPIPEGAVG